MLLALLALLGCRTEGCLGGETDCRVETACSTLEFTCDDSEASWSRVERGGVRLNTNNAVMSPGDWVLENEHVFIVISDLDHPHFIAPTGGNLVDMATFAPDGTLRQDDSVRNIYQVGGLLPTEAMAYTSIEAFMDGDHAVVQVKGTYDDDPDVEVYTRYELGPCDPGVRVRTELINRHNDSESVFLADAHYIGGRESLSFAPGEVGFDHPSFGLATLKEGLREVPWVSSGAHEAPGSAVSFTSCNNESITALLSEEITAVGLEPKLLRYGDYLIHERFIGVGTGGGVSAGSDISFDIREQLHDEPFTRISGQLSHAIAGPDVRSGRPQLVIYEGDVALDASDLLAVTHVEADDEGRFAFNVPDGGSFTVHAERFGLPWARQTFEASGATGSVNIELPAAGRVHLDVSIDGQPDPALVIVWPSDQATLDAVQADYLGHFLTCAPMLGHPFAGAPSCNRLLIEGSTDLDLPPGTYDFFSVAGPFSSLASARNVVVPTWDGNHPQVITLEVEMLPLLGSNMLSADFHVHGSASFDSSIPDSDRVRALLAAKVDVIVATDHDKVHDYADAMEELNANSRLKMLVGLETTGHILQPILPSNPNPKVVGHWIVWPLQHDPEGPWRGAPWDEKALPGELFTRFEDIGWPADTGVIQLNHPWGGLQFGRDFGWATTLELDTTEPLFGSDLREGHALYSATPEGARFANDAYHAQEVMNGTANQQFEQYRAIWHYMLNEGSVKAGTANSDSHTVGENIIGFPRNVVFTDQTLENFDQASFNQSVRDGRMFGTNGPVLEARIERGTNVFRPSLNLVLPREGMLIVDLSAADWVNIDELRVIVNGETVQTNTISLTPDPHRPGIHTATYSVALSEVLPESGDAWLSIEAGVAPPPSADLTCDGIPDTGDNNGDGTIDWRDIEDYADLSSAPETTLENCFEESGPLRTSEGPSLPNSDFQAVVPEGYPLAFTNPFLFDGDGNNTYDGVAQ